MNCNKHFKLISIALLLVGICVISRPKDYRPVQSPLLFLRFLCYSLPVSGVVLAFGRKNARTCFANSGVVQVFEPGLSILKDSLLEALIELTFRIQKSNCSGRPGIKSLSQNCV